MKCPKSLTVLIGLLVVGTSAAYWKLGWVSSSSATLRDALKEGTVQTRENTLPAVDDLLNQAKSSIVEVPDQPGQDVSDNTSIPKNKGGLVIPPPSTSRLNEHDLAMLGQMARHIYSVCNQSFINLGPNEDNNEDNEDVQHAFYVNGEERKDGSYKVSAFNLQVFNYYHSGGRWENKLWDISILSDGTIEKNVDFYDTGDRGLKKLLISSPEVQSKLAAALKFWHSFDPRSVCKPED